SRSRVISFSNSNRNVFFAYVAQTLVAPGIAHVDVLVFLLRVAVLRAVGVRVSDHTSAPVLRQPDVGWSQAPAVALFIGSSHRPTLLLQRGLPALYRSGPSRLRSPAFPSHRVHSAQDGQQKAIQGRFRTAAFSLGDRLRGGVQFLGTAFQAGSHEQVIAVDAGFESHLVGIHGPVP